MSRVMLAMKALLAKQVKQAVLMLQVQWAGRACTAVTCIVTCALPVASCALTKERMVPESTMPLEDRALL